MFVAFKHIYMQIQPTLLPNHSVAVYAIIKCHNNLYSYVDIKDRTALIEKICLWDVYKISTFKNTTKITNKRDKMC